MSNFLPKPDNSKNASIRISEELLEKVDKNAFKYGISRNKFIIQCIEYALSHMESDENSKDNP